MRCLLRCPWSSRNKNHSIFKVEVQSFPLAILGHGSQLPRSTDSDVGPDSVLWSQLPDFSELLWSPSVIVSFLLLLKIFLGIAQPEAYGLEGVKKGR